LKSPLFSISGYTEMLSDPGTNYEKKVEILGNIQRNIKEMSAFISGLLDLSRAGKVIGDISDLPIDSLINSIFREAEISARDVTFSSEGIPQTIRAGYRIKEVFQNLITNAIQAKMEDRHLYIKVNCRSIGRYWEFNVNDNGKGIEKGDLERIFIPGFTTSSGKTKGSGFGLSIAERIIQAHNGGIIVESKPGEGTSFTIMLPKQPSI
jgi:signal transduction histidine kinase